MLSAQGNSEIQPKRNAPYSGFGLGDPLDQFFVASGGMGGLSATFQDAFHLNLRNPASLAYLQATAFEVGFNAKYSILDGGDEKARSWGGNLAYLALGFPLKNPINEALDRQRSKLGWGMAFSLQPTRWSAMTLLPIHLVTAADQQKAFTKAPAAPTG